MVRPAGERIVNEGGVLGAAGWGSWMAVLGFLMESVRGLGMVLVGLSGYGGLFSLMSRSFVDIPPSTFWRVFLSGGDSGRFLGK